MKIPQNAYNNILVAFNMIYDTDIGLIKVIKEKYNNPKYINSEYLNSVEDDALRLELIEMKEDDPLELVLNKNISINKKLLYDQLYDKEYENIVKNSTYTNILKVLEVFDDMGGIGITILCKNEIEEHFIRNNGYNFEIIYLNDDINLKKYDTLYFKSIYDVNKFVPIEAKNIFVSNHLYNFDNFEEYLPKANIVSEWIYCNRFHVIDMYKKIKIYG